MTEIFSIPLSKWGLSNSSMITVALLSTMIAIIVSIVIRTVRRNISLPPGPSFIQLTLLRNMLTSIRTSSSEIKSTSSTSKSASSSTANQGLRLDKLYEREASRWGKVFSFRMTGDLFVVLSDPAVIRQAFVKQRADFNDRRSGPLYSKECGNVNEYRVLFGSGHPWKAARKLVSPCLKNHGTWGQRMEDIVQREIDCLNDKLAAYKSESFDPRNDVTAAVANIIYSLVHGNRLDYGNATLQGLIDSATAITDLPFDMGSDLMRYMPFAYHSSKVQTVRRAVNHVREMMSNAVSEQASDYNRGNITTIIERIIMAAEEMQEDESDVDSEGDVGLKTKEVWRLLYDIMLAGSDTTANTLKWILLAMAHYTEVQKKVHDEIDDVLGGRKPEAKDQKSTPYIQATIYEMLRSRPVLPLSLPHIAAQTAVLQDYTIPKGTILLQNIWACHHDPEYWNDPEAFTPERFLSDDGKSLGPESPAFMPFSVGGRKCAGDQLARMELFLIFTSIMQRFDIEYAPGTRPDEFDDGLMVGATLRPNAFNIRMVPRLES